MEGFTEIVTFELNPKEFKGKWEVEGWKGIFRKTECVILSTTEHIPEANMALDAGDPKIE